MKLVIHRSVVLFAALFAFLAFFTSVYFAQPDALGYILVASLLSAAVAIALQKLLDTELGQNQTTILWVAVWLALIGRVGICLATKGAGTDLDCFVSWAHIVHREGYSGFYTSGYFADYPPGYIYLLRPIGALLAQLGLFTVTPLSALIVSLPAMLCDSLLAILCYTWLKKDNPTFALKGAIWLLFTPLFLYNSTIWKQVDSVAGLLLLCCFIALTKERPVVATIFYSIAVLTKPQVLLFGPIFAFAFFLRYLQKRETLFTAVLRIGGCGIISLSLIWVLSLPFQGEQHSLWLLDRYQETMSSYPYASVNAPNLFALLGGNFVLADEGFLLSYSTWGFLFLAILSLFLLLSSIRMVKRGICDLFLLAGFYGTAIFTLLHGMHERYLLLSLLLLGYSAFYAGDRLLQRYLSVQAFVTLLGMFSPYLYMNDPNAYSSLVMGAPIRVLGLVQVILFAWLCIIFAIRLEVCKPFWTVSIPSATIPSPLTNAQRLVWSRVDSLLLIVLTASTLLLGLWQLGDTDAPQSSVKFSATEEFTLTFDTPVAEIWSFAGINDGSVFIFDGETDALLCEKSIAYNHVFMWQVDEIEPTETLRVVATGVTLNELSFVSEDGITLTPGGYDARYANLFDESDTKPERPSYLNSMYFDEIYHGRTAFEQFGGYTIYETTHPPLGKDIIMLGIALFGMAPFGWRVMGALFGALMVPTLYLIGRRLFQNRHIALFCATLFLFDFMRFTQTRIATIDSFVVLFILLSYYFMIRFSMEDVTHRRMTHIYSDLFFCGLFFGMGCAAKWTGIYSGVGLCILFFRKLWLSYRETGEKETLVRRFVKIILSCFVFFVFLPSGIYLISYLPQFYNNGLPFSLEAVFNNQRNMFSYHSGLVSSHPFASEWWEWPLLRRPVWYFFGSMLPNGVAQSIALLGNPIVWWGGMAAMVGLIVSKFQKDKDDVATILLVAFLAQYLPWIFVERETFLYHFFPSLPFVILAFGWVFWRMSNESRLLRGLQVVVPIAAAGLFLWFYPLLSGAFMSNTHHDALRWFSTWVF